ncbi:MAG: hypothetical protein IPN69_04955 [Acidobacteria bacterium]|nr:hypothetical protein [Acidobacteriota bacterium]MBK8150151.1 hypothetical protein [Acidobacteriota bacterium]MBK8810064.1 hypothetical protein [Acidobacteriota bacterium]
MKSTILIFALFVLAMTSAATAFGQSSFQMPLGTFAGSARIDGKTRTEYKIAINAE